MYSSGTASCRDLRVSVVWASGFLMAVGAAIRCISIGQHFYSTLVYSILKLLKSFPFLIFLDISCFTQILVAGVYKAPEKTYFERVILKMA
jgi:hypothetical protein